MADADMLFEDDWWQEQRNKAFDQPPPREGAAKSTFNPGNYRLEGYKPPEKYYSIAGLREIGLDIETYDRFLKTKGPGERRVDEGNRIVGIGIGPRRQIDYYPIYTAEDVFKPRVITYTDQFLRELRKDALEFEGEIVGANLIYDLTWLMVECNIVFPKAKLRDVQVAEALIDENRFSYSLNTLSQDYLGRSKKTDELLKLHGPGYIENMHRVDPGYSSEYCREDIQLCFDLFDMQKIELEDQELWPIFELECKVTPVLLKLRKNGVRIDINAVEQAVEKVRGLQKDHQAELNRKAGFEVEVWANDSLAKMYDAAGVKYEQTKTGRPSFRKQWLEAQEDEVSKLVKEIRRFDKISGTFLQSYLIEGAIGDRIYGQFHQLRGDENGTVSGRFSSSNPNLQNIPTRDPMLGPICRGAFIPEEGMQWGAADWSQIEYRFFVHYAHAAYRKKPEMGTQAAVDTYANDKAADFHAKAAEITGLSRSASKNINFGIVYGMGVPSLAASLGLPLHEARVVLNTFAEHMPFGRELLQYCSDKADERGWIKTILGRRRRFSMYEAAVQVKSGLIVNYYGPKDDFLEWQAKVKEEHHSIIKWVTPFQRAKLHSALNALLQGSAADLMKKAMVDMDEGGIFDVVIPHLTVHDELDVSVPRTAEGEEAFKELVHMMEVALPLNVPVFADAKLGENWSKCK